jgi:hypothetical protein
LTGKGNIFPLATSKYKSRTAQEARINQQKIDIGLKEYQKSIT